MDRMDLPRTLRLACIVAAALLPAACDAGTTSGPAATARDTSNTSDTRTPDGDTGPTGPTCGTSSDCDYWYCQCSNGSVVNSRTCDHGRCQAAEETCPAACADIGATFIDVVQQHEPVMPVPDTSSCGGFTFGGNATCGQCYHDSCCSEGTACGNDASCLAYWDCAVTCRDQACLDGCIELYPDGQWPYESFQSCLLDSCQSACGL